MAKWNLEVRKYMFKKILDNFGPKNKWNGTAYPGGKRKEFSLMLSVIVEELKDKFNIKVTYGGVHNQILWACQNNKSVKGSWLKLYMENTLAALDVGFISMKDLPDLVSFTFNKKEKTPVKEEVKTPQNAPEDLKLLGV